MIVCPHCRKKFNFDEALNHTALEEMVRLAAAMSPIWALSNEYVDAFRADKHSDVSLKKRVRLLSDLAKFWETGMYSYSGKQYRVDKPSIKAGLQVVCNLDKFGFKNHNYFKKILTEHSERISAEGMTAAEEMEREEIKRTERRTSNIEHRTSKDEGLMSLKDFRKLENRNWILGVDEK